MDRLRFAPRCRYFRCGARRASDAVYLIPVSYTHLDVYKRQAIVSGGQGTAAGKITALRAAGIAIAETPSDMADTLIAHIKNR